jgi:hypothetical protein
MARNALNCMPRLITGDDAFISYSRTDGAQRTQRGLQGN